MSTFIADPGPAVAATDVDWAIIDVLRDNYGMWLTITSNERKLPSALSPPERAAYANALDQGEWLDRWTPAVLITTAKTTGPPMRFADGVFAVAWTVAASVIVRGTTPSETRDRASLYEVALRRCLGHRNMVAGAGGIVHQARWVSTEIVPVANISRTGRYLAAGMATFTVLTDAALKDAAGPTQDGNFVTGVVADVQIDIEGYSPDQDFGG